MPRGRYNNINTIVVVVTSIILSVQVCCDVIGGLVIILISVIVIVSDVSNASSEVVGGFDIFAEERCSVLALVSVAGLRHAPAQ